MKPRTLLALTLSIIAIAPASAVASLHECYDATCRVHVSGHAGTGCIFAADDTHYYVLTNAHVTRQGDKPRLVFVMRGAERSVDAETVWHSYAALEQGYHRDIAVIKAPKVSFGDYTPSVIPLAEESFALAENQEITSVGCPGGGWVTAWKGHATSLTTDAMNFVPPPMGGRSGSAIFDADGTKIVGLLAWGGGGEGTAQTIGEIYRAMRGEPAKLYTSPESPTKIVLASRRTVLPEPLAPLADIAPRQAPCPNCPPVGPSPIRPPARPQQPPSNPGDGGGDSMPFPLPPGIVPQPQEPSEPQPPPQSPPPSTNSGKPCECDGAGKCQCKPEDQCLCDGKDTAALLARVTILEAQIKALANQKPPEQKPLDLDAITDYVRRHLPPITVETIDDDMQTRDRDIVYLGESIKLRLHPIARSQEAAPIK